MSELEMEIGRILGASAFFVYTTIKHNPNFTAKDIEIETGLSQTCVEQVLVKLRDTGVVKYRVKTGTSRLRLYKENEERQEWKFH